MSAVDAYYAIKAKIAEMIPDIKGIYNRYKTGYMSNTKNIAIKGSEAMADDIAKIETYIYETHMHGEIDVYNVQSYIDLVSTPEVSSLIESAYALHAKRIGRSFEKPSESAKALWLIRLNCSDFPEYETGDFDREELKKEIQTECGKPDEPMIKKGPSKYIDPATGKFYPIKEEQTPSYRVYIDPTGKESTVSPIGKGRKSRKSRKSLKRKTKSRRTRKH